MKVKHMLLLSKVDNLNGEILVAFARCANSGNKWILDSTISFHICINRDWFITYESLQGGGSVRLGDDNPWDTIEIGYVQITCMMVLFQIQGKNYFSEYSWW